MINPNEIINFNRTDEELEELILFLVAVAGKKASTVAVQLDKWINEAGVRTNPFALVMIRDYGNRLEESLKNHGFGCYTRLTRAFRELANSNLDLRTCTKEDLMQIHGIGRKSASCFLAWTREGEKVAMLDTHLLKHLTSLKAGLNELYEHFGLNPNHKELMDLLNSVEIPKSTPSSKRVYDILERVFLRNCELTGNDPVEFDLKIWRHYSAKGKLSNGLDSRVQSVTI